MCDDEQTAVPVKADFSLFHPLAGLRVGQILSIQTHDAAGNR